MGGTPAGVEVHNGKLRINFSYAGKRRREPLGLPPTKANIKYAGRLTAEIKSKIRHGLFDYNDYFPGRGEGVPTVREYSALYLSLQTHLADSTIRGYRQTLKSVVDDRIGDMPITHVKYSTLGKLLKEHGFKTAKARNNALTPIKGLFELAVSDQVISDNPAVRLKSAKTQAPSPDPLTMGEAEAVLAWLSEHRDEQTLNYFQFALFTGLRTNELLALRWPDVDLRSGLVRVQRGYVLKKDKTTKTAQARDVELTRRARQALDRQRAYTFLAGEHVFIDPITTKPYVGDKPPRLHWNAALRALGIRHRTAYQTRHTFATLALMSGANPMWVARQMGHSTMQMTLRVYSRWIDKADHGRELAKLDKATSGDTSGTLSGTKGRK